MERVSSEVLVTVCMSKRTWIRGRPFGAHDFESGTVVADERTTY